MRHLWRGASERVLKMLTSEQTDAIYVPGNRKYEWGRRGVVFLIFRIV